MNKSKSTIKSINSRTLKYGSLSVILVVAVAFILIMLNAGLSAMETKGIINTKFDLTSNKRFSISDTTKEILKKLDKDVEVYGLFDIGKMNSGNDQLRQIKETLSQYEQYSHIKIHYQDPDKNPGLIKQLDPSGTKGIQKQDFVVKSGNKIKVLSYSNLFQDETDQTTGQTTGYSFIGEQSFTGAVKYVSSEKTPVVYFTQGHSEGTLDSDYSTLKSYLETNNYDVKPLKLATESKVPDDAEILIVASPKSDLTVAEKNRITEYLKNGGNAVFLIDSLESDASLKGFENILANYNIGLNYDKVKENDKDSYVPGNPYAVVFNVPSNAIIPPETQLSQLLLVNSRSLKQLKNTKDYITVTPLLTTTDKAVGEQINKGKDIQGPFDIAFGAENKGYEKPSKIIVIGNGAFLSDTATGQYAEYLRYAKGFLATSLNWMMDKQDDVLIDAKAPDNAQITVKSDAQLKTFGFALMILLPLLIFGTGAFVWIRRRHL